jgi:hypothetical protein
MIQTSTYALEWYRPLHITLLLQSDQHLCTVFSLECFRYILQFVLCNACKDLSQVVLICWMQYAIFFFPIASIIYGFMGWFYFSLLFCQDVKVRPLVEYDSKSLEGILPEIPLWVKNPDYDRVCSFVELAGNYVNLISAFRFSFSSLSLDWLAE